MSLLSTHPDDNCTFLVRRSTDNATQSFTAQQVNSGGLTTWLNGAEAFVQQWANDNYTLSQTNTANQIKLTGGANAAVNNYTGITCIGGYVDFDLSNDFIVTLIVNQELNTNNQRQNLAIRDAAGNFMGLQLFNLQGGLLQFYKTDGHNLLGNFNNNAAWKLITLYKINSVFGVDINNVFLNIPNNTVAPNQNLPLGSMVIGARGWPLPGASTLNAYTHFDIVTGENLSGFNKSSHNQSIMTKHGI